jgi:hypothetical protein
MQRTLNLAQLLRIDTQISVKVVVGVVGKQPQSLQIVVQIAAFWKGVRCIDNIEHLFQVARASDRRRGFEALGARAYGKRPNRCTRPFRRLHVCGINRCRPGDSASDQADSSRTTEGKLNDGVKIAKPRCHLEHHSLKDCAGLFFNHKDFPTPLAKPPLEQH